MKKLLALILACVMIIAVFASCNTNDNNTETPSTESEESTSMEETTPEITTVESESVTVSATEDEADTSVESDNITTSVTTETETESESESKSETESESESVTETETETVEQTTEEITTSFIDTLNISSSSLSDAMQNMFADEKTMWNETLFFIDKGETKRLIYPATKIISVTSYDRKTTYTEGVDYILTENGDLKVTENSSIPCITSEVYYNNSDKMISVNHNGETKWVYWGEGDMMTKWQVSVTYEHNSEWDGYKQASNASQYENVIKKLQAGEDVTIMFYGDSITCGANASWFVGKEPSQGSYSMLFTEALADLFGYTVRYIDVSHLKPGMIKPTPGDYVAGTNGTITYINTAVGGWTSNDGYNNFDTFVKPYVQEYGCDLFVIAFGGNDAPGGIPTTTIANNFKKIIASVNKLDSDVHFMMVATMVTNTLATNGWYVPSILDHELEFLKAARYLNVKNSIPGAVTNMTSMSLSVLDHKDFVDYTGNNINHPNDFFERVYAQTLLQSFIGYENMN